MADLCSSCDGVGVYPDLVQECPYCQGSGWLTDDRIEELEAIDWEPSEEPRALVENIFELMWNEWFREREFNELLQTFDLQGVDLSDQELAWLDFSECDLRGSNFSGCDLRKNQFCRADLRHATFDRVIMTGTLDGALLAGASFRHASFDDPDLTRLNWEGCQEAPPDFSGANLQSGSLSGIVLTNAKLESADLSDADLGSASLKQANLRNVRLANAELVDTDLEGSDLRSADLTSADLSRSNLRKCDLSNTRLEGATLKEADLRGADLRESSITSAKSVAAALLDESTRVDARQRRFLRNAGAIVESPRETARIDIDWSELKFALRDADLRDTDLRSANLQQTDMSKANLSGADLSSASLEGANLERALLSDAHVSRARLRKTSLKGAKLDNADLSYANMIGAVLTGADLTNANLQDVDLTGAEVHNANLLSATNIEGTNLTNAVGLSDSELKTCLSRGAVVIKPEDAAPEPDTRRYKNSGKARGMALAYSSSRRQKIREQFDAHLSPDQQAAARQLSNALDLEAFLGREHGLNKQFVSEYDEVALNIMAWLNSTGYFISKK